MSVVFDQKRQTPSSPGVGPSQHHQVASATHSNGYLSPLSRQSPPSARGLSPITIPSYHQAAGHSQTYTRPRGLRISNLIKPWIPLIMYGITSFGFIVAIAFWKKEVFEGLDELSQWLRADGDDYFGYSVLFVLIFITTFPPIPLYSTLIILSGYTFGPWTGAIISYCAALSGALTVFILSRTFLRASISRWLSSTCTIKRVVRAIEKRPKLLFLIRLAPYPYNVMNCLLAASSTLTLKTYTVCTALSLFKVIIHTSVGASIHSFKDYNLAHPDKSENGTEVVPEDGANAVGRMWTIAGVSLCIAILVYLSYVARKAVDDELDDEPEEERIAFLSPHGMEASEADMSLGDRPMVESPFSTGTGRPTFHGYDNRASHEYNRGIDEEASIGL